ncbi:Nif3-like dinuclear metal center hexameric protein [Corynebacterium bovis]|uniref:Nif3-like dinuclear metal center hexameric protein n=1 Tax=Corynebacterium bovis TaxID=36808 RepID=UPI00254D3ADC|nr:Nif3-like dinuclear metal center hexameric protein [Corynebacterium bovis]MDK8510177.1 Nif3-like dinuclear metal center hexameric protein [Corynebacterium bovis]
MNSHSDGPASDHAPADDPAQPAAGTPARTVADVVAALETAYPPQLAESWDAVGLVCGDPDAPVRSVVVALECTDEVAAAAVDAGADMIVVHHPLLLRGVTGVPADHPKGRIVHRLIRAGVALFAAHTNADSARPGVNDRLAEVLGVTPGDPLDPQDPSLSGAPVLDRWGFTVPVDAAAAVKEAVFAAGAGAVGTYTECSFEVAGTGQFRPGEGSVPTLGSVGALEHVEELRVEFVAPRSRRRGILAALRAAHPYEEVAYDVVETVTVTPAGARAHSTGIGRVGPLDTPMTLREFTRRVAERLPTTVWGVRAAGDPERMIRTVAVASGAGDGFLATVRRMDVDCLVTSDLRHHPVDEHLRAGGCPVVDTSHWASEYPWCAQAADVVTAATGVPARVLDIRTDPWTVHAGGESGS